MSPSKAFVRVVSEFLDLQFHERICISIIKSAFILAKLFCYIFKELLPLLFLSLKLFGFEVVVTFYRALLSDAIL